MMPMLGAIAVYLKDLPPSKGNGGGATGVEAQIKAGAVGYDITCAACHGRDGKGSTLFPPLAGNATVRQVRTDSIVRMVLAGGKAASTPKAPTAPGHAQPRLAPERPAGGRHPHLCAPTIGAMRRRRCRRRRWAGFAAPYTVAASIAR